MLGLFLSLRLPQSTLRITKAQFSISLLCYNFSQLGLRFCSRWISSLIILSDLWLPLVIFLTNSAVDSWRFFTHPAIMAWRREIERGGLPRMRICTSIDVIHKWRSELGFHPIETMLHILPTFRRLMWLTQWLACLQGTKKAQRATNVISFKWQPSTHLGINLYIVSIQSRINSFLYRGRHHNHDDPLAKPDLE